MKPESEGKWMPPEARRRITKPASISTTLDRYGHLFEGLDEGAADRLDAAFLRTPANFPRPAAQVVPMAQGT